MPETPPEFDLAAHKADLSGKAAPAITSRRRTERFDRDTKDKLIALLIVFILLAAFFLYIQS